MGCVPNTAKSISKIGNIPINVLIFTQISNHIHFNVGFQGTHPCFQEDEACPQPPGKSCHPSGATTANPSWPLFHKVCPHFFGSFVPMQYTPEPQHQSSARTSNEGIFNNVLDV